MRFPSDELILVEGSALNYLVSVYDGNSSDLVGVTGAMQVRESYDSVSPILDLDTAGGGVEIGDWSYLGHAYNIHIYADATLVVGLPEQGTGVWDLLLMPGGDADDAVRVAGGSVRFLQNATQL